jgi:peptidoglycan/LPS O-acetylase OafA/YrhL
MTRPELKPLTAVRGLFAWAVVLFHVRLSCAAWMPAGAMAALSKGYLAVDFFFLLSGFVIWLNYGARLRNGGRAAAADFLVQRIARVWPLHVAMLAFAALIAAALLATGRPAPHFPFALLPLHLAMMQDWGFSDALLWNDPAWSISAEWAAYLLTPIAALLLPHREGWRTPALLAAAALPLLLLYGAARITGMATLGLHIPTFGIVRCLAEFACGIVLCDLWRRWRGDGRAETIAWLAGAACLAGWAAGVAETLAVPFAFASLLLALAIGAERPRHPLGGRAIHYLGEISYATYLSHFLLFFAFKLAFVGKDLAVAPLPLLGFLAIVLPGSIALYHLIERPAQRAMLRLWAERGARLSPARSIGSAPR